MGYAMLDKPNPRRAQGRPTRRNGAKVAGLAVIHTFEIPPGLARPDTSAERGLNYLRTRRDPGCYHRLVDADSRIPLYPFEWETWHCRFTNNWSNGFCMATQASAWDRIPEAHAEAMMLNCAKDVAEFIAWCKETRNLRVPVRWVDRAAAMRREPGITMHGITDPSRRTDPGFTTARAARFLTMIGDLVSGGTGGPVVPYSADYVREVQSLLDTLGYDVGPADGDLGPRTRSAVEAFQRSAGLVDDGDPGPITLAALRAAATESEDDMLIITAPGRGSALIGPNQFAPLKEGEDLNSARALHREKTGNDRQFDLWKAQVMRGVGSGLDAAGIAAAVKAALADLPGGVDPDDVAQAVVDKLGQRISA